MDCCSNRFSNLRSWIVRRGNGMERVNFDSGNRVHDTMNEWREIPSGDTSAMALRAVPRRASRFWPGRIFRLCCTIEDHDLLIQDSLKTHYLSRSIKIQSKNISLSLSFLWPWRIQQKKKRWRHFVCSIQIPSRSHTAKQQQATATTTTANNNSSRSSYLAR